MELSQAPAQIVEAWATGDSSKTNPIPVPSQIGITPGAASYTDGFPPLCATPVSSGGIPPTKADMNGILYGMSAVDVWMCAGGGFPYSSAFSTAIGGYPKGARVLMASGAGYWVSTVDNNVTDPDTGGAGWASADENAITALTGDVTATGPGSAAATLAASGVTPGSYTGANITVDAKGRVTAAASGSISAGLQCTRTSKTGTYLSGVTYTNSTGMAVFEEVSMTGPNNDNTGRAYELQSTIDGSPGPVNGITNFSYGDCSIGFWVPSGSTFSVIAIQTVGGTVSPPASISNWTEVSFGI